MDDHDPSRIQFGELYPDIVEAGSLGAALGQILDTRTPSLTTASLDGARSYAYIARGIRASQVSMALQERSFSASFWKNGVRYAHMRSSDLSETAHAIHIWLVDEPLLDDMQNRFPRIRETEIGRADENGEAREHQWVALHTAWQSARSYDDPSHSPLYLIEAGMKSPELRRLYPYTSLYRLCFRHGAGYPYQEDFPYAVPLGNGRYRAYSANYRMELQTMDSGTVYECAIHDILGEGTAEEVIAMLVANLPPAGK